MVDKPRRKSITDDQIIECYSQNSFDTMKSIIAEAIGTATMSKKRWIKVGRNPVEEGMSGAVITAYKEANDFWHRSDLDQDKKHKIVAQLLDDDAIRNRIFTARSRIKRTMERQ